MAWVDNGREAFDVVDDGPVAVVILDLSLPDMDGLDVCRALREGGYSGGIMMMTGRAGELDIVVGLDSGADDYLLKPFGLAELLARVRAVLRRTRRHGPGPRLPESPLRIDVDGRRAYAGATELRLTNKEFGVLRVLTSQRGRVVPRSRIMSEVWDVELVRLHQDPRCHHRSAARQARGGPAARPDRGGPRCGVPARAGRRRGLTVRR